MVHACQRHLGNVDDGGHDHDGKNQRGGKQRVSAAAPDAPHHRHDDRDAEESIDDRRNSGQKADSRLDHLALPPVGEQRQIDGGRQGEWRCQDEGEQRHHKACLDEGGYPVMGDFCRGAPVRTQQELANRNCPERGKSFRKEVKRDQDDCSKRHKGGEQQDRPEPTVDTFSRCKCHRQLTGMKPVSPTRDCPSEESM